MYRPALPLLLVATVLLAGCGATTGTAPTATEPAAVTPTQPEVTSTPTPTRGPGTGAPPEPSPDEPPLDLDAAPSSLPPTESPHYVRIHNDGDHTRTVELSVSREGRPVSNYTFRLFPNTTVLGAIDHAGEYTLALSVDNGSYTARTAVRLSATDCDYSETVVDVTEPVPSVETTRTDLPCDGDRTAA